ncbi:MAG: 50S ribosomal protein L32 [Calditrichaeota bacterium]|nr:MAG: 50S ribosomal protein L32 [Calditrichota bacterium]
MPLPKRRHSKSRGAKRRTHWKLSVKSISTCSHCHQPKLPHRACPNCGYYNGRSVFVPKEV